jgi:preprotein translocase subunit SecA
MRRFNASMVEMVMTRLNVPDDVPIEHKMVTRAIRSAQTQVEQQNFEIRKNVLKYDEVMNRQRTVIYAERHRVLAGEDLKEQVEHMIQSVVEEYVNGATADGYAEDWDFEKLWTALKTLYPVSLDPKELLESDEDITREYLRDLLVEDAMKAYRAREADIDGRVGEGATRELERRVLLSVLDRKWREHLYEMDYLKEGIGLRAMAQRDPLIEYQREGFDMFNAMLDALKEEVVGFLFNLQVEAAEPEPAEPEVPVTLSAAPQALPQVQPQGGGARARARAAAAAQQQAQQQAQAPAGPAMAQLASGNAIPPALRGKGLGGPGQQHLSYSGPAEDGGVEQHGEPNGAGGQQGGTRKERREAARQAAKNQRKHR